MNNIMYGCARVYNAIHQSHALDNVRAVFPNRINTFALGYAESASHLPRPYLSVGLGTRLRDYLTPPPPPTPPHPPPPPPPSPSTPFQATPSTGNSVWGATQQPRNPRNALDGILCVQGMVPWPAHTVGQVGQWPYHFFQDPSLLHTLCPTGADLAGAPPPPFCFFTALFSSLLTCCRYVATPGLASSASSEYWALPETERLGNETTI